MALNVVCCETAPRLESGAKRSCVAALKTSLIDPFEPCPMSTAARLPSGMQAGRAMKPAKVRNVDLGQHYAELPAKHETCERSVNVCFGE